MESEPTTNHLSACEKFYIIYPDIQMRILKSKLPIYHYFVLSKINIKQKERDEFEKKASKERCSIERFIY